MQTDNKSLVETIKQHFKLNDADLFNSNVRDIKLKQFTSATLEVFMVKILTDLNITNPYIKKFIQELNDILSFDDCVSPTIYDLLVNTKKSSLLLHKDFISLFKQFVADNLADNQEILSDICLYNSTIDWILAKNEILARLKEVFAETDKVTETEVLDITYYNCLADPEFKINQAGRAEEYQNIIDQFANKTIYQIDRHSFYNNNIQNSCYIFLSKKCAKLCSSNFIYQYFTFFDYLQTIPDSQTIAASNRFSFKINILGFFCPEDLNFDDFAEFNNQQKQLIAYFLAKFVYFSNGESDDALEEEDMLQIKTAIDNYWHKYLNIKN